MKTKLVFLTLVSAFSLQPSALLGQGSLSPPGAPAPTMKTLAQIEPRALISSAPLTINVPGSYYLTTNLTVAGGSAITIATNNVMLDLNGFTISSTDASPSGFGVYLSGGLRNITVLNGFIQGGVTNNGSGVYSGPGFNYGIYYSGVQPKNVRVTGVSVSGCLYHGIYPGLSDSTVVESCTVRTVGSAGIIATVIRGSIALDCGGQPMSGSVVSDSHGEATGTYDGLDASVAQNCYGRSASGVGVYAYKAMNCAGVSTSDYGLIAENAENCSGSTSSGSYGLYADVALNCMGYASGSGTGLRAADVAIGCRGYSSSGIGVQAYIANSCRGATTSGTNVVATYKYNMP